MSRQKLIAGNWKMNGSLAANQALITGILEGLQQQAPTCAVAVCPPSIYCAQVASLLSGQSAVALGVQDVSEHASGAYTGNIAAHMLQDFGVRYAIVGHSERRQYQGETSTSVAAKAQAALAAGITPIVCVGETLADREAGQTLAVVGAQLAAVLDRLGEQATNIVLAYEPVWAIGTGQTAAPAQAQEVHAALRTQLQAAHPQAAAVRILYGGSMNAGNAQELLAQADIDGGLIGGAALKPADFLSIIAAA